MSHKPSKINISRAAPVHKETAHKAPVHKAPVHKETAQQAVDQKVSIHKAKDALALYFTDLTHQNEVVPSPLEVASKLLEQANLNYIQADTLLDEAVELEHAVEVDTAVEIESAVEHEKLSVRCTEDLEIKDQRHKENDDLVETVQTEQASVSLGLKGRLPSRFQVLLFEVAGIKLAAPLVELGRLLELGELSTLPGKPSWFMGVLLTGETKQYCVDTARVISPERYEQFKETGLDYGYALQLDDSSWSLACSNVSDTHELNKNDVNWRENSKSRPWFAGMIKQKMCALIDVSQMIEQLESSPTNTQYA